MMAYSWGNVLDYDLIKRPYLALVAIPSLAVGVCLESFGFIPFGSVVTYSAAASEFSGAERRLGLGSDFQRAIAHWWRSLKRRSMSAR